ncbi:DUF4139 domain-containing protein [Pseudorhodobacter sp. W20_MBD10_FR17]|uniref:DUF4139 domain-containing protein n=1 Tax=Pseudorhodobacter sp. W20_MBD10_FR17 TaxID=3240266 RepID=UPI003F97B267
MRLVFGFLIFALPVQAETIFVANKITDVVVYPQGAKLTRLVEFSATAGQHDVVITDFPLDTVAASLRLMPSEGLQIGAYALRNDRVAPREAVKSDAQIAAEAALEVAVLASGRAQLALDAVTARVDAANAQIAYLNRIGAGDAKAEVANLQATAQMIGAEVLAASNAALAARADLPAVQKGLKDAFEVQARAQAALDALGTGPKDHAEVNLAVSVTQAGPMQVEVTQYVGNASWMPIYDIALDRGTGQVVIDRSLLVSQNTGEDWAGVALTVSTAQPSNRADPSQLWPDLHRVEEPVAQAYDTADRMMGMAEPVMEAPVVVEAYRKAAVQFQGDIVSYAYPDSVSIADGADNLRLALDEVVLPVMAQAQAVPRYDATAYMMATFTNTSDQILLPGPAMLMRDGAFVGEVSIDTIAPGAKASLGFGAIEGLRLKRVVPARAEGDRGVFTKSNQIEQTAVLSVENLTAEDWAVRVMDVIPHSEQEELVISYTANPPATEQDVDDKRGVLAWDVAVPAGAVREVTVVTRESWPEGKELR